MEPLAPGAAAPDWKLPAADGGECSAAELDGKRYVIYFYPRDNTPGCTREACDFRDSFGRVEALGVPVFGVSTDSLKRHRNFQAKYELPFTLLSDEEQQVINAFGAGKGGKSARRMTFIVGPDGLVEAAWPKVKVKGHVDEVLAKLEELNG